MQTRMSQVFTRVNIFMTNKTHVHISTLIRKRRLTDLTFSFSLPYLGTMPETVTLLLRFFDIDLASLTICSAIFCESESSFSTAM